MFVVKGKNLIIAGVLILACIAAAVCIGAMNRPDESVAAAEIKVVIDAGHGGIDGGVVGVKTGKKESELNLAVSKKLAKHFQNAGIDAVFTRKNDAGLYGAATGNLKRRDMEARRDIILKEKPTLVISVHMNKYPVSSRRGAQVFFNETDGQGKQLADCVQKSFNAMEEATREYAALKGDYYILNSHPYPACIAECGFLSNPEDEALLLTEEYQEKIAYAIFKGAIDYLSETTSYAKFPNRVEYV
ncbi:MAG: hypothetical protein DBX59_02180 [Bacillota bacterium]|nr:MAG: hypothetical protein DBX59_02180 [Bacillota bacterium]